VHCRRSESWPAGMHAARASCVLPLQAGIYYHVVATTSAQNADHVGQVTIEIVAAHGPPSSYSRINSPN
jgi:hypothetical protein